MTEPGVETLDWQRIEDIFHRLSGLPADQREAMAGAECADDPTTLQEVLALLRASGDPVDRVDGAIRGTLEAWASNDAARSGGSTPERLGPFRILRRLSEGGQAVVYLAEREKPYRQLVAIKLLKRGMDTDEILRRLNLERQILAQLEHPNIARLLDGGSSPDGRPYFALEYIDGDPIDRFCDLEKLDVKARLRLFSRACSAVHIAHSRLVIHRDLKPSNLLVTREGEPKLLDFGIAKLLDTSPLDATAAWTRTGVRWMTPNYAAPEQVFGQPLTTAVDIYALGVLLYQLLTGELPRIYANQHPTDIENELAKRLEPPSARVARVASAEVASSRNTTIDRLSRTLHGDLDTIIGKTLQTDAERRYASVQQMAEDVDRYLRSEPVLARGDTWSYRWSKFVHRNRSGVGAIVLIFASLIAGIIGTTRALRIADSQRMLAEQRLDEVEAVMGFTTGMFEIADPGESRGSEVTVLEVLEQGAERVDGELKDQPAIAARLMTTMGSVYQNLGLYGPSSKLLRSAEKRWLEIDDRQATDLIDTKRRLAAVLIDDGRFQEALQLLQAINGQEKQFLAEGDPSRANTLHLIGLATRELEGNEAAEPILRQALQMRTELLGPKNLAVAESLNDLGQLLFGLNRLEEAQELLQQGLTIRSGLLGKVHPRVAESAHNLATVLQTSRQLPEAEEQYRDVLSIRKSLLGESHRDVAVSLNNLSRNLCAQNRHEEARETLRDALVIVNEILPKHPLKASILNNLALELKDLKQTREAIELITESLALRTEIFGAGSEQLVIGQFNKALLLADLDQRQEAIELLQTNLQLMDVLGIDDRRNAYPLTLLAEQHALAGDCASARPLIAKAIELRRHLDPTNRLLKRSKDVAKLCP